MGRTARLLLANEVMEDGGVDRERTIVAAPLKQGRHEDQVSSIDMSVVK